MELNCYVNNDLVEFAFETCNYLWTTSRGNEKKTENFILRHTLLTFWIKLIFFI